MTPNGRRFPPPWSIEGTDSKTRRGVNRDGFAFVPKPLPCTSDDIGVVSYRQPAWICATGEMQPDQGKHNASANALKGLLTRPSC